MGRFQTVTVIVLLAAVMGAAAWVMRGAPDPRPAADPGNAAPPPPAPFEKLAANPDVDPELIAVLQEMRRELDEERAAHAALREELAALRRVMPELALAVDVDAGDAEPPPAAAEPEAAPAEPGRGFWGRRGPVTVERLVEAGFAADQARRIVTTADAVALERLNLQYQARREGWAGTERYREALGSLPSVRDVVNEEYGAEAYDRYLYASGRPNRLVVRDVFQGSAAEAIGLQPGDTVLAMANQRVYSARDLRTIASDGTAGETVPIMVQRGEQRVELYVPRGPLGVRARQGYENPDATP